MTKDNKNTVEMIGSFIVLLLGVAIILTALFLPPQGIIDNSVLIAFGEALTFVGSVWGIKTKYDSEINKFNKNNKQ